MFLMFFFFARPLRFFCVEIQLELIVLLLVRIELIPHVTPTLGPSSFSSLTRFVISNEGPYFLFLQCES
jgi:hypothetical protein